MIGQAIGAGLGLATAKWQDKRQVEQQQKLQDIAMQGSKEMGKFNQGLALDMWEKTNYEAQRKQMEKAGLNVGLMYGGGGAGGGTTSTPTGSMGSASASGGSGEVGMGMQMGLAAEMQKAQIENLKANTTKTKVEAAKTGGIDTEAVGAQIQATLQNIKNAETQNRLMGIQEQMQNIELNVAGLTQEERVKQMEELTNKLTAEVQSAKAKGEVDEGTVETLIKQAGAQLEQTKATTAGTKASTEGTKATTEQTKQNTKNLEQDEINKWLNNQMKANGVEPSDNAVVRIAQRWLGENNVNLKSVSDKMKQIGAWMKGQNGTQNMERFREILNE